MLPSLDVLDLRRIDRASLAWPTAPFDLDVSRFLLQWLESSAADQTAVCHALQARHQSTLLTFAERMAIRAADRREVGWLVMAGIAIALEGGRADVRDTLRSLSIIYRCAEITQVPAALLFDRVVTLCHGAAQPLFASFLARPDAQRRPSSMGYEERVINGRLVFLAAGVSPDDVAALLQLVAQAEKPR